MMRIYQTVRFDSSGGGGTAYDLGIGNHCIVHARDIKAKKVACQYSADLGTKTILVFWAEWLMERTRIGTNQGSHVSNSDL